MFALPPAIFGGVALVLLLSAHFPVAARPAAAAGDCTVTAAEAALDAEEKAFLTAINSYRVANGRPPLRISYYLTRPSAWKSKHMGQNSYFAHDDTPIGRSWSTRVRDCGYTYSTAIGENIAAGYTTAASVFAGWQGSPGHNSNMLSTSYTAIGIGRHFVSGSPYGWYWTTVFGGVDDGWYSAPETITAISGDVEPLGWSPQGHAASSVGAAIPRPERRRGGSAGGSGLDFSGLCETLRRRDHPLAPVFCGVSDRT